MDKTRLIIWLDKKEYMYRFLRNPDRATQYVLQFRAYKIMLFRSYKMQIS